jgi:hypothetical protein
MKQKPNIKFMHMFKEFNVKNNVIVDLFTDIFLESGQYGDSKEKNLTIVGNSNIGWSTRERNDLRKSIAQIVFNYRTLSSDYLIWYGNELQPKPHKNYDLYLYYNEIESSKSIYFPAMYLTRNFFSLKNYEHDTNRIGSTNVYPFNYSVKRTRTKLQKKHFCCAFINNLTPERERVISALSKIGRVDVYGSAGLGKVEYKYPIANNYKFFLCMENDFVDGYITEKALEAWECESLPIWWGSDTQKMLNDKAMIKIDQINDGMYLEIVDEINKNEDMLESMIQNNILNLDPSKIYEELKHNISNLMF